MSSGNERSTGILPVGQPGVSPGERQDENDED